jgi:cytidylate kinase
MVGTFVHKLEHYEETLGDINKEGLTITVSGLSGTGKTTIAEAIANEFNLRHVSVGEIFRELANKRGIKLEELPKLREHEIDYEADKETLKLARQGGVVLNGRLTGWVAGANADVRILVTCDLAVRAKRVAKRDNKSIEAAKRDVEARDNADNQLYREIYGVEVEHYTVYDFVLDNSRLKIPEAQKMTIDKIRHILALREEPLEMSFAEEPDENNNNENNNNED